MKNYTLLALTIGIAIILGSCKTNNKMQTPDIPLFVGDNSATSLDWPGTYTGTLPCADCEGILTTLVLNADLTYELSTRYSGKSTETYTDKGKFKWNELGNIITLEGIENRSSKFFVGENKVLQLDMQGQPVTGVLADKYMLNKQVSGLTDAALTGKRWKLIEINGAPVKDNGQEEPVFIEFQKEENKVNGFAGCNHYFGNYELKEGNRITFSKIASTMMACPDLDREQELFKIFETADNYTIYGNELTLNKARMAPLAKFALIVE
ncbi:MAG: copper resistance protein NlpE N-terminal domain-containing protein [Lentimicrobium sp.]|jgi:heat shock protein HslJ|nr:copper resistance protein NlpE N-terminal domain-containing protein [Lentimicrobium sp.]